MRGAISDCRENAPAIERVSRNEFTGCREGAADSLLTIPNKFFSGDAAIPRLEVSVAPELAGGGAPSKLPMFGSSCTSEFNVVRRSASHGSRRVNFRLTAMECRYS